MPRQISLTNFLSQIKSRYLDHGYQPLKSDDYKECLFSLSSPEKTFYDSKQSLSEQSQDTNQVSNVLEKQKQIYYCSTRRMLSQNSQPIFEIVYEIHNGFTSKQSIIIENALQIVVNRLFKPEILYNMYRICKKSGCFLTNNAWSHSNLTKNSIYHDEYLLLQYQLMCLKTKSESGEFPIINIYPTNRKSRKKSNKYFTCVSCISHGSTFLIDGDFEIGLNQHEFNGTDENSSNALFWAGVIVYKMLCNLGHRRNDSCFPSRSQINIFQKCFLHDGNYFPNNTK